MRQARAGDYWKALQERKFKHTLSALTYENLLGLPIEGLTFRGPITAIAGLNGAGKTTLLQSLFVALSSSPKEEWPISVIRMNGAHLKLDITIEGATSTRTISIEGENLTFDPVDSIVPPVWIDSGMQALELSTIFGRENNLPELLAQYEPTRNSEIALLRHVIGKDYRECMTYELEDFHGHPIMPYFKVVSGEATYGTEAMGLGELALHYIVWALRRASLHSVILIEEPETFVAEQSQTKLMDFVAKICVNTDSWAVITTHSQHILRKVPPNHTAIVARFGETTKFIIPEAESQRLTALGLPNNSKEGVLLVEDRIAGVFITTILERYCPALIQSLRVVDVSGAGNVVTKVNQFPKMDKWFQAVAVLDGDERSKKHECEGLLAFLPGDVAPEILLEQLIKASPGSVAEKLRLDCASFELALSSVEGMEHHDWLEELSRRTDKKIEEVAGAGFDVWIDQGENSKECETLAEEISKALFL
jgi:predicted ATPase